MCIRDSNGKEITRKIEKKTGIRVEIIDGQEEAHIVYDNHIEQLFASGQNYLYVDVGGGSTEINLICDSELKSSRSYNKMCIRDRNQEQDADGYDNIVNCRIRPEYQYQTDDKRTNSADKRIIH